MEVTPNSLTKLWCWAISLKKALLDFSFLILKLLAMPYDDEILCPCDNCQRYYDNDNDEYDYYDYYDDNDYYDDEPTAEEQEQMLINMLEQEQHEELLALWELHMESAKEIARANANDPKIQASLEEMKAPSVFLEEDLIFIRERGY